MNKVDVIIEEKQKGGLWSQIKNIFINNSATILFVIVCLIGIKLSRLPLFFIANELLTRIMRNSFLVLSLIIPVLAGMGLNFSIIVGAMAAQIAIIAVTHWGISGIEGFLLCVVLSAPIAILFGKLIGKLLNRTRGQEMIASMIVGFFANGIYQFIFLFLIGTLIPMKNKVMVLSTGVGIRNAIDLSRNGGLMYSLDNLIKVPLFYVLLGCSIISIIFCAYKLLRNKIFSREINNTNSINKLKYILILVASLVVGIFSGNLSFNKALPDNLEIFTKLKLPVATLLVIIAVGAFNILIVKTKIGQDFRTVGQDKHIAKISGINVDKVRVLAITISTLFAAWGQLIFLQNIGTLNTYGSHMQIGLFSIAALLIGGASVAKASVGQGILGVILLHTLFIVSPNAGKNLFGDAQTGEYFRSFVAYGVIGVSLALHAWKKRVAQKNSLKG